MPIEVGTNIRPCNQEEFHELDRQVMGIIFEVHNEFGPLMDEEVYKSEIAARCLGMGLAPAEREVRIRVTHDGFSKDYLMDLLVCGSYMLEGKAADCLVDTHRAQALNYLLLLGLQHGRLVNFRTQRVEHEFVSTTLTHSERRRLNIVDGEWADSSGASQLVRTKTVQLLEDWGAFLDVNLYRDALVYFLGGWEALSRSVAVQNGSRCAGTQRLNLLDEHTGLAVTSKRSAVGAMRDNLQRLLRHTPLKYLQWVNFNGHRVEFTTLSSCPP
jgi:GxxExxY protein